MARSVQFSGYIAFQVKMKKVSKENKENAGGSTVVPNSNSLFTIGPNCFCIICINII